MITKAIKVILTGVFSFFLVLIETSAHLFWFSIILVFLLNLMEDPKSNLGLWLAFFVGVFIDFSTTAIFGIWTIILVLSSIVIKYVLAKFLKLPHVSWIPKI